MTNAALQNHVQDLLGCRRCPKMQSTPISGGAVMSDVVLVGQAPGVHEPRLGRPFAWTAGKTLFQWFEEACGFNEEHFRSHIYMAAVCRCFPGKHPKGSGDRVPDETEIANCAPWLTAEITLLHPKLVILVGKLAIHQFLPKAKLADVIGHRIPHHREGVFFDIIALPHPSGASAWRWTEPGKTLLRRALTHLSKDPSLKIIAAKARKSTMDKKQIV